MLIILVIIQLLIHIMNKNYMIQNIIIKSGNSYIKVKFVLLFGHKHIYRNQKMVII